MKSRPNIAPLSLLVFVLVLLLAPATRATPPSRFEIVHGGQRPLQLMVAPLLVQTYRAFTGPIDHIVRTMYRLDDRGRPTRSTEQRCQIGACLGLPIPGSSACVVRVSRTDTRSGVLVPRGSKLHLTNVLLGTDR